MLLHRSGKVRLRAVSSSELELKKHGLYSLKRIAVGLSYVKRYIWRLANAQ